MNDVVNISDEPYGKAGVTIDDIILIKSMITINL